MSDPTVVTDRETFRETCRDAPRGARVPVEVRVRVPDPFEAYRRARDGPGGFYLATTGGRSGWGYFGVEPIERLQVRERAVALSEDGSPSLESLTAALDGERLVRGDCDVPYPCGLFGWLSYDLARELEDLPDDAEDDRDLPRLQFGLYDRVAAWEEPRDASEETTLRVTACPRLGDSGGDDSGSDGSESDDSGSVERAFESGRERALELARAATDGETAVGRPPVDGETAAFESDCGRSDYADRVRRAKEYVRDGDTFQANVSQRLVARAAVHPVEAFDALRRVNPAPYSCLLEFPGVDLVSASPELLLDVDGDRVVTEPIAGTRPRGETPEADADLEADLLGDEKERAEHAMLVDLERNDLGKVCAYGSVEVSDYRRVDRYSEVMHLVSEVEGRLREDADLADAIAAVFPGGTITGAPKPRTMEIIDELESTRRGPYTGSVGVLGFDDRATLDIVIRTLVRHGEEYHLRVGAGIVHDSVPETEYEETLAKARALLNAVDEALGEERRVAVE
ncbi:anthranilate synthase component I family protein [Halorussus salilacus]|uniref:anthranilate synthase component I family protein n=1 Tax=Halorussus salilacus TaxID=2953750 RepID=UPI00209E55BC|nr:anthranilate synthase component I family protein [Halorussus salilacus]USZ69114.1 anthranilate synthase component I family protein [Halorussus salilacus]